MPAEHQLQPGYALVVVGFGPEQVHTATLDHIRAALPPAWAFVTPMPYVALQQMLDDANAWGLFSYEKGLYVEQLSDDVIDVITDHLPRKTSPLSALLIYRLDGAYSAITDDDTAFGGGRSPRYALFNVAVCPAPEMLDAERAWVRSLWDALSPHATLTGSYVNSLTETDEDRLRATYGDARYQRLARITAAYDPENVFQHNANIKPAPALAQARQQRLAASEPRPAVVTSGGSHEQRDRQASAR